VFLEFGRVGDDVFTNWVSCHITAPASRNTIFIRPACNPDWRGTSNSNEPARQNGYR
jgi:hypothetical protein